MRVSIGMPIYNGENFMRGTIDSILSQTYRDFELIISDNGSTDATQSICEGYAANDPRVRYYREEINKGAAWNYNRVVHLAEGGYFKWAAHDDPIAPEYLKRCVEVLDGDPGVVLCHSADIDIDNDGQPAPWARRNSHIPSAQRASSAKPYQRFRRLIRSDYDCEQVFGVIRLDVLRKTSLILSYTDSDRTLLAELGLYGRFHEVPEGLFYHRHHQNSSGRANPISKGWYARAGWFDPKLTGKVLFPQWRQLIEYVKSIFRAPLALGSRFLCFFFMTTVYRSRLGNLLKEILVGTRMAVMRK